MSEIEYSVSEEDLLAFNEYHLEHSPSQKRAFLARYLAALAVTLMLGLILWNDGRSIWNAVPAVVGGAMFMSVLPVLVRQGRRRAVRKLLREGENRGFHAPQQIRIEPEGLACRSPRGESRLNWTAIEKVVTTPDHAFLYVSSMSALVIPRKSVTTGDYDQFLRELQRRIPQTNAIASTGA